MVRTAVDYTQGSDNKQRGDSKQKILFVVARLTIVTFLGNIKTHNVQQLFSDRYLMQIYHAFLQLGQIKFLAFS